MVRKREIKMEKKIQRVMAKRGRSKFKVFPLIHHCAPKREPDYRDPIRG